MPSFTQRATVLLEQPISSHTSRLRSSFTLDGRSAKSGSMSGSLIGKTSRCKYRTTWGTIGLHGAKAGYRAKKCSSFNLCELDNLESELLMGFPHKFAHHVWRQRYLCDLWRIAWCRYCFGQGRLFVREPLRRIDLSG